MLKPSPLTEGPILAALLRLAVPVVLPSILQTTYSAWCFVAVGQT
jgi:hypothetical protein